MNTFILTVMITFWKDSVSTTTQWYSSQKACEKAGQSITEEFEKRTAVDVKYICTSKE